ncbi:MULTISPECIES: P-type conjugative transfer protein TrbL [Pseudomonas]|uniref:P-type conjugative transfer protein TrbL n=1 Tax=Pseudomonas capeferrum TaxID=1495066 RepID=A0ABY7R9Z9_9PSED|nr:MULTISPECIES: P-type conjugative transfer protein TrbL [Pseudomonas]MUT49496.1 P-type conjugative transfer protein TrbL [Pseudomonas sp. TDA1]WCI00388.1 P-type conjugative transfer protein TrbL [Pseudomonas capeferrum]
MKLKNGSLSVAPLVLGAALLLLAVHANAADSAPDIGFFDTILQRFSDAAKGWRTIILQAATRLFWTLAVISMVWTFGLMALRKADIGEFFAEMLRFIMFVGFYFWLLTNGPNFADSLVKSLSKLGSQAGGLPVYNDKFGLSPSEIVQLGFDIFGKIVDNMSMWPSKIAFSIAGVVMGLAILMVLVVIAINMLLLTVSAWVLAYAGIFFLGFGGARWTSDMAINYFKTVLGMAVQILAMLLLLSVGKTFLDQYYAALSADINGTNLKAMAALLVCCVVLMALVAKIPPVLAGIINGSSVNGGGIGNTMGIATLAGAAAMAASAGASALSGGGSALASGMANAAGGAQSMYSAFKSAQSNVASGSDIVSRMSGMFGGGGGGSGSGGSGGNGSPLSSAMGLASAASGGMDGGVASSAMSAMSSAGGQSSGGGAEQSSEAGSGSGGGSEGGSSGAMEQAGSSGTESGGGQSSGGGEASQRIADSGAGGQSGEHGGGKPSTGSGGGSGSASKLGNAGRIALDMGANLAAGVGRMAQARIDQTAAGRLAAEISSPGSSRASSNLNTSSTSRNFDPASEVADFRDSKLEKS